MSEIPADAVRARIEALREEMRKGQARLDELQVETAEVRDTMLRIAGAIQGLTELLEGA